MNTSTELSVIRKYPHRFTWGSIDKIHDIGPYTIVEYKTRESAEIAFHVYVDEKNTSSSTATLEGALLLAIARKHLEVNTARYMAMGACKLLGVNEV